MGIRRKIARIVVLPLSILMMTATAGAAFAFHGYSVGHEETGNGFTGVRSTRLDVDVRNQPHNGCTYYITGDAVYQSSWIALDNTGANFMEFGTGHQCEDSIRYAYSLWVKDNVYNFINFGAVGGSANPHTYELVRASGNYNWERDGVNWGAVTSTDEGPYVQVGLESYANGAHIDCYGTHTLKFKKGTNSWNDWSGQDSRYVNPIEMNGHWVSDTHFQSAENESC